VNQSLAQELPALTLIGSAIIAATFAMANQARQGAKLW